MVRRAGLLVGEWALFVGVALGVGCAAIQAQATAQASKPATHWGYEGDEGPGDWAKLDPAWAVCAAGVQQSPIDIRKAEKAELETLEFAYLDAPLNIIDNGHTVMVSFPAGSTLTVGGHVYTLKQFHFHHPSEEKVDGKTSAMVIHLVHADAEGKLAVVAVLLEPGAANPAIQTLWDHLPKQKGVAETHEEVRVNAGALLPADRRYYTFMGSLTTPPCSESVRWFVMKAPVWVSAEEISAFAGVYPLNARPTQALNGRVVRESR